MDCSTFGVTTLGSVTCECDKVDVSEVVVVLAVVLDDVLGAVVGSSVISIHLMSFHTMRYSN